MKKMVLVSALMAVGFLAITSNRILAQTPTSTSERAAPSTSLKTAVFAGGCFWCVEADFEKLAGVTRAVSGYAGGRTKNPTYNSVSHGNTGHYEVVEVQYDPALVSYDKLLEHFWTHVDPTDDGGQFCDRGHSYKTAIFADTDQIERAQASKQALKQSARLRAPVVTPVLPLPTFYKAEKYHQDYYKKSSIRYKYYRKACRRDARIKKVWGK